MLTIFAIPKAFTGKIKTIQENAVKSWLKLQPPCQIVLLGDDEGVAAAAAKYKVQHIPGVSKTDLGTPFLDCAFAMAQKAAKYQTVAFVNADIILMPDFIEAVKAVNLPSYLIVGRRWDIDINEEIDFDAPEWRKELSDRTSREGRLHGAAGMDYFIFHKGAFNGMPAFIAGRQGLDNWLIWKMRKENIPVIDATGMISAIHQNHDYSHSRFSEKTRVGGPETRHNFELSGGFINMLTMMDANLILDKKGLHKPPFPRNVFCALSLFYPWRLLLLIKRQVQNLTSRS